MAEKHTEFLDDAEPQGKDAHINLRELEEDTTVQPDMHSPDWSDYVLSLFETDEMFNGNPTVDGLRRIAGTLLGPIIRSETFLVQPPTEDNNNHAAVEHVVHIMWDKNPTDIRIFRDVADIWPGNVVDPFDRRTSTTAATIAEGRALRKALQLKRVFSTEEVSELPPQGESDKINNSQITWLNMMCQRNDINVLALIKNSKGKYDKIEDVPYSVYINMRKYLSDYQNDVRDVPDNIKGYDPNWRKQ
jgi:hypothetical protein